MGTMRSTRQHLGIDGNGQAVTSEIDAGGTGDFCPGKLDYMSPAEFEATGYFRRRLRLLVTMRPVAWLSARYLPGLDRRIFRWTHGRVTLSAWVTGLPILLITTTGARTGRPRTVRLLGIPENNGFLIIAANFGDEANPAWYHNVRAHPRVTIATDATSRAYDVKELKDDERAAGFDRALLLNPGWGRFRRRAAFREIPVLRITPDAQSD